MQVAIVVYPGYTALDALGPYQVLAHIPGVEPVFVAEQAGPVTDSRVLTLEAQAGWADLPHPDVILVAGGMPAITMSRDGHPLVDWIREAHRTARWTTSVCTGSLLLGAAGVLQGRRATSHWFAREMLREFGAVPVDERVVVDGTVVTGAGSRPGSTWRCGWPRCGPTRTPPGCSSSTWSTRRNHRSTPAARPGPGLSSPVT